MIIIICAAHKNHRPAAGALTFENFFFLCIICAALENHRLACAAERDSNDAHVGTPKCCRGFFFFDCFRRGVAIMRMLAHPNVYVQYVYICMYNMYIYVYNMYIYIYIYVFRST